MRNKKGSAVVFGFVIIFFSLLAAIFLGLAAFGFNLLTESLGQDVEVGQVNLKNITDATFGQINIGIINSADNIGIILMLGMCLLMIVNGYYLGSKNIKLFFVVDIFLLILFFIPAIYVSQIYELFINSTAILSPTYINIIPMTSKFVLSLPIYIAVTGIITMILSYSGLGKKSLQKGDGANVLGF